MPQLRALLTLFLLVVPEVKDLGGGAVGELSSTGLSADATPRPIPFEIKNLRLLPSVQAVKGVVQPFLELFLGAGGSGASNHLPSV
jgi:hypothetical protein